MNNIQSGSIARGAGFSLPARVALGGGLIVAAVGLFAAPASAHNYPVGYAPAENSVITEQPGVFSVTTNDLLLNLDGAGAASAMQITGPKSADEPLYYGDGCATVSGATVEKSAQLGGAGDYTVIWQSVSTDGHAISGEYSFTWKPREGQELATGSPVVPTCGGTVEDETPPTTAAPGTVSPGASAASSGVLTDVAWIGGSLGMVLLAVGATLFVLRRKSKPETR
ncbi:copper resistance CopC family protein [Cryobacterium psychrophilum]|uniref:Copper resistance protein CopC n=1 Tax=Cryobacterium psychrophilum TaxID=41988 RepID=A0A4Y8KPP5_9MICO|nr:copper resistance protein CopC [Cryobacterium psychrophilum]TFD76529.1 copper resistance protein CopC [Cryobacterium psychrophilum]